MTFRLGKEGGIRVSRRGEEDTELLCSGSRRGICQAQRTMLKFPNFAPWYILYFKRRKKVSLFFVEFCTRTLLHRRRGNDSSLGRWGKGGRVSERDRPTPPDINISSLPPSPPFGRPNRIASANGQTDNVSLGGFAPQRMRRHSVSSFWVWASALYLLFLFSLL